MLIDDCMYCKNLIDFTKTCKASPLGVDDKGELNYDHIIAVRLKSANIIKCQFYVDNKKRTIWSKFKGVLVGIFSFLSVGAFGVRIIFIMIYMVSWYFCTLTKNQGNLTKTSESFNKKLEKMMKKGSFY